VQQDHCLRQSFAKCLIYLAAVGVFKRLFVCGCRGSGFIPTITVIKTDPGENAAPPPPITATIRGSGSFTATSSLPIRESACPKAEANSRSASGPRTWSNLSQSCDRVPWCLCPCHARRCLQKSRREQYRICLMETDLGSMYHSVRWDGPEEAPEVLRPASCSHAVYFTAAIGQESTPPGGGPRPSQSKKEQSPCLQSRFQFFLAVYKKCAAL
jgi:hypothetical protein